MDWFDEKLKALENERNFKLGVFRRIIDEKGNPVPRNPAELKAEKAKFLKSKKLALIGRTSEQKKRSYSGGLPLLPSEIAWPMVDETPFVFICQIDLSEISIDDKFEWLPDKGTIFFFVAPSTCDETAPELFRVIHSFDSTDHQHPLPVGGAPPILALISHSKAILHMIWNSVHLPCRMMIKLNSMIGLTKSTLQENRIQSGNSTDGHATFSRTKICLGFAKCAIATLPTMIVMH